MTRRILSAALIGALVMGFSACMKPVTPAERIKRSQDSGITKTIIENLKEKKFSKSYDSNRIVIEQYISGELGHMSSSAGHAVSAYQSNYDSSRDQIAQNYIDMAKNRGNEIKLYKNNINSSIAKIMPMPWEVKNEPSRADLDNALIEYDKNNRIVSALIRAHTISKYGGYIHYRYSIFVYGNLARGIESRISNNVLENGYITTLTSK